MSLVEHAKRELKFLKGDKASKANKWMEDNILELVDTFAKQGHSGSSAEYAIAILNRLLKFKPLVPLTGEDSEWNEISDGSLREANNITHQNRRCSTVFKNKDGKPYILKDNGIEYIEFPYEV